MELKNRPHLKEWRYEEYNGAYIHRLPINNACQIILKPLPNDKFEANLMVRDEAVAQLHLQATDLDDAKDRTVMAAIRFSYRAYKHQFRCNATAGQRH